jgi:hypothetical protein
LVKIKVVLVNLEEFDRKSERSGHKKEIGRWKEVIDSKKNREHIGKKGKKRCKG